ncbi:MAG: hypothetical protein NC093_03585 [Alistipes sp.]|nr:hypothetical protein [Alistipes sp.]
MKKGKIALALAAAVACGTMTACTPTQLMLGMSIVAPTMIGYNKKAKIQNANADAKTVLTLANMALTELEEEGVYVTYEGWYDKNEENISADNQWRQIYGKMCEYADAEDYNFSVYISGGACLGAVAKNRTFGIYPTGGITASDCNEKLGSNPGFDDAKAAVEAEIAERDVY